MPDSTIEFAAWATEVQDDDLSLIGVRFGGQLTESNFRANLEFSHREDYALDDFDLEASFISLEKRAVAVFGFKDVSAFRVLDEHGLVELWNASAKTPRPAGATFKVRGHAWQTESELSWIMGNAEFSHMIATGWLCLEVITSCDPQVSIVPAQSVGPISKGQLH